MIGVHIVFGDLQPVAWQLAQADVVVVLFAYDELIAGEQRRRLSAEIGPDQAARLVDLITGDLDTAADFAVAPLGRNVHALAGQVVFPCVIGAPDAVIFDHAATE